jgi:hypothetical protein
MIGNDDLWIAAHAKAAGLTLVTNNEKEFRRVRGLKVENWAVENEGQGVRDRRAATHRELATPGEGCAFRCE